MNDDKIKEAKAEAKRFLKRVTELEEMRARNKGDMWSAYGMKEHGAVKRASLDLTRALAKLRKPM